MKAALWLLLAVACNVGAQFALKFAAVSELRWQAFLSLPVFAAAALYGLAFILTARIYADYPLSFISPFMAGMIFLGIALGSAFFLAEALSLGRLAGMALIVAGIALLAATR